MGSLDVASGTAVRFQARLNRSGTWFAVAPGDWLTSIGDGSVYGNPVTVEYRGCRDTSDVFCGPASGTATLTPINARGAILSCVVGSVPQPIAPVNGGAPVFAYFYAYDQLGAGVFSDYEEDAIAPEPLGPRDTVTRVRMKTVVTLATGQTYTDAGFAEGECQVPPQ